MLTIEEIVFFFASFTFKENRVLVEEDNPSDKDVIVTE